MTDPFVTADELAAHLRVTRETVWKWAKSGRIPSVRIGAGHRVRFDLARVLAALGAPHPAAVTSNGGVPATTREEAAPDRGSPDTHE